MHQQSIDNPAELVDVVQSDSAEEPGNDQDEMMDVKTNEADSENDNYADDEDVFNASDNEALDESDSDDWGNGDWSIDVYYWNVSYKVKLNIK